MQNAGKWGPCLGAMLSLEFGASNTGQLKGREEYLYSAIYTMCVVSKCSDMDHTVLPANYTMPAFSL